MGRINRGERELREQVSASALRARRFLSTETLIGKRRALERNALTNSLRPWYLMENTAMLDEEELSAT